MQNTPKTLKLSKKRKSEMEFTERQNQRSGVPEEHPKRKIQNAEPIPDPCHVNPNDKNKTQIVKMILPMRISKKEKRKRETVSGSKKEKRK